MKKKTNSLLQPKLKAIIFDFDGVIIESMGIKEKAFVFLFQDYPEHREEIIKLHRLHGGLSRFEKFKIIYKDILKAHYSEKIEKELGEKFYNFTYQEVLNSPFVRGAKEFLENYHKKLSLFIASGTPDKEIKSIARDRNISRFFVEILGSPETKAQLCLKILKKYNLLPEEVIMVGDAIDDYEGAKAAGIGFVGRGLKTDKTIRDLFGLEKVVYGKT